MLRGRKMCEEGKTMAGYCSYHFGSNPWHIDDMLFSNARNCISKEGQD